MTEGRKRLSEVPTTATPSDSATIIVSDNGIKQVPRSAILQGALNADTINYDNSASGLSATNVQEAIDEVVNRDYSSTIKLGKYKGKDLFRKYISLSSSALVASSAMQWVEISHGIAMSEIVDYNIKLTNNVVSYELPYFSSDSIATYISDVSTSRIRFRNKVSWSGYMIQGWIDYIQ